MRRCTAVAVGLLVLAALGAGQGPAAETDAAPRAGLKSIADRLACSSLCQAKQGFEKAAPVIAGMGFRWVDLSALSWAPHVSVAALAEDFEREAGRVESILAANKLAVANFTFDAPDSGPFEVYAPQFELLAKLAARWKVRLINVMAPAAAADRQEAVRRLRELEVTARRHGVLLSVETHCNQLTELPRDAAWLCREVPGLGVTLDPSHYYAGPNQGAAFDELYPLAYGTGLRAGGMSWAEIHLPWGAGCIDFAEVVRKLQAAGYAGFYAAEYIEGFNEVDAVEQSRRFLDWGRSLGAAAE